MGWLQAIVGDIRDEWDDEAELMVRETAQGLEVDARCEIEMLEEQARVYVMCNDYYHYEKSLRKLTIPKCEIF